MSARLLVAAGHDSSGRAGVDADREAAGWSGVVADCVVTARTVQDGAGVRAIGARDPDLWRDELLGLAGPEHGALKLGLLPGAEHVVAAREAVGELRGRFGEGWPVVLDPVLAASSGERFLDPAGVAELVASLRELAPVLTPNIGEAAELAGESSEALARDVGAREQAARRLGELGARAVLLKGGHGSEDPVVDLLWRPGAPVCRLEHARAAGAGIRGSGCRYASAVAAGLAEGRGLVEAAGEAGRALGARIAAAAMRGDP